jgi:hypothetical protein
MSGLLDVSARRRRCSGWQARVWLVALTEIPLFDGRTASSRYFDSAVKRLLRRHLCRGTLAAAVRLPTMLSRGGYKARSSATVSPPRPRSRRTGGAGRDCRRLPRLVARVITANASYTEGLRSGRRRVTENTAAASSCHRAIPGSSPSWPTELTIVEETTDRRCSSLCSQSRTCSSQWRTKRSSPPGSTWCTAKSRADRASGLSRIACATRNGLLQVVDLESVLLGGAVRARLWGWSG